MNQSHTVRPGINCQNFLRSAILDLHYRGAQQKRSSRILRLLQNPCRIFGTGQFRIEIMQPEPVVNTLQEHPSRRLLPVDHHSFHAFGGTAVCGGQSRRPAADHGNIIIKCLHVQPLFPISPRCPEMNPVFPPRFVASSKDIPVSLAMILRIL